MRTMHIALLLGLLGLATVQGLQVQRAEGLRGRNDDTPAPIWHTLFSIDFNETSIILFKRQTTGRMLSSDAAHADASARQLPASQLCHMALTMLCSAQALGTTMLPAATRLSHVQMAEVSRRPVLQAFACTQSTQSIVTLTASLLQATATVAPSMPSTQRPARTSSRMASGEEGTIASAIHLCR